MSNDTYPLSASFCSDPSYPAGRLCESLEILRKVAEKNPDSVWEIGFSGGKDSTVLCHLVFEYLSQSTLDGAPLPRKVHVLYCDTLLDLPIFRENVLSTMESISAHKRRLHGLVETKVLRPAEGEDFFSMMIDQGYSAPHFRFRWCMGRLKIYPTLDYLSDVGSFIMLTGVRLNESNARRRNLQRRKQTEPIATVAGNIMVAPLLNWETKDIWSFLMSSRQPWSGESYQKLFKLYRLEDNLQGCGKCELTPSSRFGCWVCTVIRRDRMLENLMVYGDGYKQMLDAKESIRKISLTPSLRAYHPDGRYAGLNQSGKFEVINILANMLLSGHDALKAYLDDDRLRQKLIGWLRTAYNRTGNPVLNQALTFIES